MYRCIDPVWCPQGMIYDSLDDFRAMCRDVHGHAPELVETPEGYTDEAGRLVLQVIPV
jgi:hypothetical protein